MSGLGFSVLVALAAVRKGSLTLSGAIGAVTTGTLITWRGGYAKAALLVVFFVTSSILSRMNSRSTDDAASVNYKGSRRDIAQVFANGAVPTALALISGSRRTSLMYVGSLAAVTGDTWATEIGALSRTQPRHILTRQPVIPGTSGGVTALGTFASILGGAFIGSAAETFNWIHAQGDKHRSRVLTGIVAGVAGSLVDSLLGATVQERRWCDRCLKPTEQKRHQCGEPTRVIGGITGVDNDAVNLLCSLSGAGIGWMVNLISTKRNSIIACPMKK